MHGTVTNATSAETGIAVNGVIAAVVGDQFVANNIPLEEGVNTITVRATDSHGNTQTAYATITAALAGHHIRLVPSMTSGSAPFTFTLSLQGSFSIEDATISYTDPGPAELVGIEPDEYRATMVDEGITWFTAEAMHEGVVYSDTVAIVAVDVAQIDALLQQKWTDMKTGLISGNTEQALEYFYERSRENYRIIYDAVGSELPNLASQMQEISMIYCIDGRAKYRIRQDHVINGQTITIAYYVYFIRDDNGLWWIEKY